MGTRRKAMPKVLKELGARAIERHDKRDATPEIEITSEKGAWSFQSPYKKGDEDEWEALLFEAFATRSIAAFHTFTNELAKLCSTEWNGESQSIFPDQWELRSAIQIVRSIRPRNEAESCLAAQMVAVHRMQMKLSEQALKQSWPDPRTCAIAGKLARTYATQLETMAKLRGKGSKQQITVKKFAQHEHKHIHLHPGDIENGERPHGPKRARAIDQTPAEQSAVRAALQCKDQEGNDLPMSGGKGQVEVPIARRS